MREPNARQSNVGDRQWTVQSDQHVSYSVRWVEPLLAVDNPALLAGGAVPGRRFLVFDAGVPRHLRNAIEAYFDAHAMRTRATVLSGGERNKEFETVLELMRDFHEFGLDRKNEPVIIFGGGAVLDAAGLAASLYRRGVPFLRIPTTLLAYVDAAVGVKCGVNFCGVKNLMGSFTAPQGVLLDRIFLHSLPHDEISSGLGEVLKLALACDRKLFGLLEDGAESFFTGKFMDAAGEAVLRRSIGVMLAELEPNLFEADLARAPDMGHTFSLSFEMPKAGPGLRHGEAVALDLNLSAVIAHHRGFMKAEDVARLSRLTQRLGLPIRLDRHAVPDWTWESVLDRQRHRGGSQRIPVPHGIGTCGFLDDLTYPELVRAMHEIGLR
jgi:3-dehydroquinate synthetase